MRLKIAALVAAIAGLAVGGCTNPSPRAVIHTDRGDIEVALRLDRAPVTTCNFLRYAKSGAYDGGAFFRTVVAATDDSPHPISVIQAATPAGDDDPGVGPIPLERTRDTGLKHVAGAISMARDGPDTATSSFFIVVEDTPALDYGGLRNPDRQGFAAFGDVVGGPEVVRAIQALPAVDEKITTPVRITSISLKGELPARCRR